MVDYQSILVPFDAGRSAEAPAIWGQAALWPVIQQLPDDGASLNQCAVLDVPETMSLPELTACLAALVERHDALRTRFDDRDGTLMQRVAARGDIEVDVIDLTDLPPEETCAAHRARLQAKPFRPAHDLPCRAAVLCDAHRPTRLLFAVGHLAVDGWSLRIVLADLRILLSGGTPPAAGQQPVERARFEASPAGRERSSRTLQHWSTGLAGLPASAYTPAGNPYAPRFDWARIESTALAAAARVTAGRARAVPSSAVFAAVSLLLAQQLDTPEVAYRALVATRSLPESRDLVGCFNQNALVRLPIDPDARFTDLVRQAWRALIGGYLHAEGDPFELERILNAWTAERGVSTPAYCFLNDLSRSDGRPPADAAELESTFDFDDAAAATRLGPYVTDNRPTGSNFFLFLNELGTRAVLTLCVERGFVGPGGAKSFLGDVERILVRAAQRTDAPVGALPLGEPHASAR